MTADFSTEMNRPLPGIAHYDRPTVLLHWLTAVLVAALFLSAKGWDWLPRSLHVRPQLEQLHVSLGILLAVVIIVRGLWRLSAGRRLPNAGRGPARIASSAMYAVLYLLLVAQAGLGFALRWAQGEDFGFFGLFGIPQLFGPNPALEHPIESVHNWVAWTLVVLALGHAAAALFHYYVLKDGVLDRMRPR